MVLSSRERRNNNTNGDNNNDGGGNNNNYNNLNAADPACRTRATCTNKNSALCHGIRTYIYVYILYKTVAILGKYNIIAYPGRCKNVRDITRRRYARGVGTERGTCARNPRLAGSYNTHCILLRQFTLGVMDVTRLPLKRTWT